MWKTTKRFLTLLAILAVISVIVIGLFTVPTTSMSPTVMTGDLVLVNKFRYGITSQNVVPILGSYLPYKMLLSFGLPKRGDIVVYMFPGQRDEIAPSQDQHYMKRCIAVAGDTISIRNDSVFVNGSRSVYDSLAKHEMRSEHLTVLNEQVKYSTFPKGKEWTTSNYGPLVIPKRGDTLTLDAQTWRGWNVFIAREGHTVDEVLGTIDGLPADRYVVERDYIFCLGDNRHSSFDSRYTGLIGADRVFGAPICAIASGGASTGGGPASSKNRSYPRMIR